MGWRIEMDFYEANIKKVGSGGTRLWARSVAGTKGWCRRLMLGEEGVEHMWEEPLATGPQGSSRSKPCWALEPGIYEAQSAGGNDEHYYRVFLVVREEPAETKMYTKLGGAWQQALEAGLVEPPSEAQLWGTVRSMCAQECWHQIETELLAFLPQTELRVQLEGYCAQMRSKRYAALKAELGLAKLKGSAAQVASAEDGRAEYAKAYIRAKQAWDKLVASYPASLEKPSHKRGKEDMEQLARQLRTKNNSETWNAGVGIWAPRYVAEYAAELEEMYDALSNGREVAKKKTRRFEQDPEEARRAEGRDVLEMYERLAQQRKELGIIQREFVEQLGLKVSRFSEYERGVRAVEHDLLWAWARALNWCVALVDAVDEGVECFPGRGSDELVKLYEKLRVSRGMSRQEVAHQMGLTLEGLEEVEAQVARGQQLSVVQAQLWAHALKWRYELGDYSVPGM